MMGDCLTHPLSSRFASYVSYTAEECYEKAASRGDPGAMCHMARLQSPPERVVMMRRAADLGWRPAQAWLAREYAGKDAVLYARYVVKASKNRSLETDGALRKSLIQFVSHFDPSNDLSVRVVCEFGRQLGGCNDWLFTSKRLDYLRQRVEFCCDVYRRCCNCARTLLTLLACVRFRALPLHKDAAVIVARLVWRERCDISWDLLRE